ncbi:MAG: homoserine O-acetyltransferase [Firmicutes bacterium]|nr:homoserine O-acetyltransferase [Bacillota bacterium]
MQLRKPQDDDRCHVVLPAFVPEFGDVIPEVRVRYETYGRLNAAGDNAILLCHALTGDAHAGDSEGAPGWWGPLIGPGRALDTERYFVVCSNVLGGCAGTTGPASFVPGTTRAYGALFPEISIRDMVRVQRQWLEMLGVTRLEAVIGGSMGGMQALEWAVMYPELCARTGVLAATPVFSAMGLAYNQVMREAITSDPAYHGGDYAAHGVAPEAGLRIARMLGMITYRTADLFEERFGRTTSDELRPEYQVGRYLRHHGDKLVARFDANAYLTLMRAMDGHDIGRARDGVANAYARVRGHLSFVGIDDDLLYPAKAMQAATAKAQACGVHATYTHIHSSYGHDAFLLEFAQLTHWLHQFLSAC